MRDLQTSQDGVSQRCPLQDRGSPCSRWARVSGAETQPSLTGAARPSPLAQYRRGRRPVLLRSVMGTEVPGSHPLRRVLETRPRSVRGHFPRLQHRGSKGHVPRGPVRAAAEPTSQPRKDQRAKGQHVATRQGPAPSARCPPPF